MKHLSRIQSEFIRIARWEDLTTDEQKKYLKKHPKSKKRISPKQKNIDSNAGLSNVTNNIYNNILKDSGYQQVNKSRNEDVTVFATPSDKNGIRKIIEFQKNDNKKTFTINAAIYDPKIHDKKFVDTSSVYIKNRRGVIDLDASMKMNKRIGQLGDEKKDIWWDLDSDNEENIKDISNRIKKDVIPWLKKQSLSSKIKRQRDKFLD